MNDLAKTVKKQILQFIVSKNDDYQIGVILIVIIIIAANGVGRALLNLRASVCGVVSASVNPRLLISSIGVISFIVILKKIKKKTGRLKELTPLKTIKFFKIWL